MVTDSVIFDFDDTLIATNFLFEDARTRFFNAMTSCGCSDLDAISNYLNEADIKNVLAKGYMAKECFPHALRQTYEYFIPQTGQQADKTIAMSMEKIGWQVYEQEAEYHAGAKELLTALQGKVNLFLLTQGDSQIQKKRLDRSGVLDYFDDFRIVRTKDHQAYKAFITDMNIDVKRSWMIGNSLRSDINPALSVGLLAVHYKIPAWDFEHEEPKGEYHTLHNLIDFLELIEI